MRYPPNHRTSETRRGVVLLAVLVVVVLLALAAYQFSDLMSAEGQAAESYVRSIQARTLADSGIHYTAVMLSNRDAFAAAPISNNPFNNATAFQGIAVNPAANTRLQGRFTIFRPLDIDSTTTSDAYQFGAIDESGKINLNALLQLDSSGRVASGLLMGLPNMTTEIADAILDWLDPDDEPRPNGAENNSYQLSSPSYSCKNGPLDSLDELLLVRGVTAQLLFGNDRNRNGILDPDENDGSGVFDRGWWPYLTLYSREQNVDSEGNPRKNINDQNLQQLHSDLASALNEDIANFIIAYRTTSSSGSGSQGGGSSSGGQSGGGSSGGGGSGGGQSSGGQGGQNQGSGGKGQSGGQNQGSGQSGGGSSGTSGGGSSGGASGSGGSSGKLSKNSLNLSSRQTRSISSLFELIGAEVEMPATTPNAPAVKYPSPLNDVTTRNQYLPILLDKFATSQNQELLGRININTAPSAILTGLPGFEESDVQDILSKRPQPGATDLADPTYQTIAWLVTQAGIDPKKVQAVDRYLTARTQVYRVQSIGYFDQGGPAARIEAVIDTNQGYPRILYRRDLSEFGKGFDPRVAVGQ